VDQFNEYWSIGSASVTQSYDVCYLCFDVFLYYTMNLCMTWLGVA
jgi:hypothetical protein